MRPLTCETACAGHLCASGSHAGLARHPESPSRAACAPTPRSQPGRKVLTEALRGVLAETATTGCIRYDWQLLKPLCHSLIDTVLAEYAVEEQVEVSGCKGRGMSSCRVLRRVKRACSAGQQWQQPELRAGLEAYRKRHTE